MGQFRDCMEFHKYESKVEHHMEEGDNIKIKGTPTFYINKKRFNGLISYDRLKETVRNMGG